MLLLSMHETHKVRIRNVDRIPSSKRAYSHPQQLAIAGRLQVKTEQV